MTYITYTHAHTNTHTHMHTHTHAHTNTYTHISKTTLYAHACARVCAACVCMRAFSHASERLGLVTSVFGSTKSLKRARFALSNALDDLDCDIATTHTRHAHEAASVTCD